MSELMGPHGILQADYWRGLPFPSPGDLPDLGIKRWFLALQADSLSPVPPRKPLPESAGPPLSSAENNPHGKVAPSGAAHSLPPFPVQLVWLPPLKAFKAAVLY